MYYAKHDSHRNIFLLKYLYLEASITLYDGYNAMYPLIRYELSVSI